MDWCIPGFETPLGGLDPVTAWIVVIVGFFAILFFLDWFFKFNWLKALINGIINLLPKRGPRR